MLRSPALGWAVAWLLLLAVGIMYFSRSRDSGEPSPDVKEAAGPENGASDAEAATTVEPPPRSWYPAVLPPASPERALEDVIAQVLPAVVSVETERGRGSGFFAAPGIVITNYHVVYGSRAVRVKVTGVNAFTAEVESVSEETDLALLRVEAGASTPIVLELGSANDVRPGQEVVAVGSALGMLESTVTRGIVSAVRTEGPLTLLETDAAINPGGSGGPLINRRGEVIGITTLKLKPAESIGFAVAADHARSLLAGGGVRPALGTAASWPAAGPAPAFPSSPTADPDLARAEAARRFDDAVRSLSSTTRGLASTLRNLEGQCLGRRSAPGSLARDWSGPWSGPLMSTESGRRRCRLWVSDVSRQVEDVDRRIARAEDDARRGGVYPATLRQIREKYGLDW